MTELLQLPIIDEGSAAHFAKSIKHAALQLGFEDLVSVELELAASELAMNCVRYGNGGQGYAETDEAQLHLSVVVEDDGKGISKISKSLKDGVSSDATSLGLGLGAVKRLTDSVSIRNKKSGGLKVNFKKFKPLIDAGIDAGCCSIQPEQYAENGDQYFVKRIGVNSVIVGVIDGLGQGQPAKEAADAVKAYILNRKSDQLDELIIGADKMLRKKRLVGAAIGLFKITPNAYYYAGIGDTFALVKNRAKDQFLESKPGTIGLFHLPKVRVSHRKFDGSGIFILCTDGVHNHFTCSDLPEEHSSQEIAQYIMNQFRRSYGDATALVLKMNYGRE